MLSKVEEVIDKATGRMYLPPCQIACPLKIDIQRHHAMISLLPLNTKEAYNLIIKIGDEIYEKNPLFPICSYICGLCEKECNYKEQTGALRRKLLLRVVSEYYIPYLDSKPPLDYPTKEKVALVGGGPASLVCGYILSKNGYRATILERTTELGGALKFVPGYRLPKSVVDTTIKNLIRIAHIDVKFGVIVGEDDKTLDKLKEEGYKAIFVGIGTPYPRPLTYEKKLVENAKLEGIMFGLNLLSDVNNGKITSKIFQNKKVITVGGGNVAFDVARTARRLGGEVSIVCLECEDKSSRDGIPADLEEIKGASEEGIKIIYSRGIDKIIGDLGKFRKISCPRCTMVYDDVGFNPEFDPSDVIYLEGDVLLITIGQAPDYPFLKKEDLLNERGRLDTDELTLLSNRKEGVFIGGDVRKIGFAAEAMRDGMIAAESIHLYLRGEDLKAVRERDYEKAPLPELTYYKPQPELIVTPVEERLNFELFEKGFTLKEAVEEAKRCLCCGPCDSCKACVELGLQSQIPEISFNQDLCSGCGICVPLCCYDAIKIERTEKMLILRIEELKCKRCGLCIAACPARVLTINDKLTEEITNAYASLF